MQAILNRKARVPAAAGQARAGSARKRAALALSAGVLALCALGLIAGGGYLLTQASSDGGWLDLGHGAYETDSYAVVTEPENWSDQTYVLGTVDNVRIRVTPRDAASPIFVGMARAEEVDRYLRDVQHVTVHGGSNYHVTYTQTDGTAPAKPPAEALSWNAQATGTGPQTLEFDAREQPDNQVLVVMNADGSPSVSGKAESLVTQPSLPWLAGGILAVGIALGAGAVFLIKPALRASEPR
jgi:hypothetical protein